jgi:hypothetical protein
MSVRIVKGETGKSFYIFGDTLGFKGQIKALPNLMFPPKWSTTKSAWVIVPKTGYMEEVLGNVKALVSAQRIQQADQAPEISARIAFVQGPPPGWKLQKPQKPQKAQAAQAAEPAGIADTRCIANTKKGTRCKNPKYHGSTLYCYIHSI